MDWKWMKHQSDSDGPKAQCFKRTYGGLRVEVPPFLSFIFNMRMG